MERFEAEEVLNLYLVAPEGHENLASVVVAPNSDIAMERASKHPAIKELTDMGARLLTLDVSTGLAVQGYSVLVSKVGMYH